MMMNFQSLEFDWSGSPGRFRVFVEGREILKVWFFDTEEGVVKTYDVMRDGLIRATDKERSADFPGREVQCPAGGVLSETFRGAVTLEWKNDE